MKKSKFILSTFALLGFGGCSEDIIPELFDTPVMYGTPLVDYRFMGELVDADGNPIEGIAINISSIEETVSTDSQGAFMSDFTSYADGSHTVTFTDIDGDKNGGEFATKSVDLEWDDAERKDGRDVFDLGTVTLDKKE